MSITHWLNTKITDYNKRHRKRHWHTNYFYPDLFASLTPGLYLMNLRSTGNNIISRTIGRLTEYRENGLSAPISHTIIFYHGDIAAKIGPLERMILQARLAYYYRVPPAIPSIENFVLASADDDGMNYFDLSAYQLRDYSIRRLPVVPGTEREIIRDFIAQHDRPYDVTGLIFWPLYRALKFLRFLDDSKSWFCSEICAEILERYGIVISNRKNPSPADIEAANHEWRIYITPKFLR